jgi:hypothetical protein
MKEQLTGFFNQTLTAPSQVINLGRLILPCESTPAIRLPLEFVANGTQVGDAISEVVL